jgi:RNase P subunit RPR2
LLSYAAKFLDKKKVYSNTRATHSEVELVDEMAELIDECDVIVAHNGKKFDMKKIRAKMIEHKRSPPAPKPIVDTLLEARASFSFSKNTLDHIGQLTVNDQKLEAGGFKLWLACMAGDEAALKKMQRYNIQDVKLLEKVYIEMRPWMKNHPNLAIIDDKKITACDKCTSHDIIRWGFYSSNSGKYQRFFCNSCGSWSRSANSVLDKSTRQVGTRIAR